MNTKTTKFLAVLAIFAVAFAVFVPTTEVNADGEYTDQAVKLTAGTAEYGFDTVANAVTGMGTYSADSYRITLMAGYDIDGGEEVASFGAKPVTFDLNGLTFKDTSDLTLSNDLRFVNGSETEATLTLNTTLAVASCAFEIDGKIAVSGVTTVTNANTPAVGTFTVGGGAVLDASGTTFTMGEISLDGASVTITNTTVLPAIVKITGENIIGGAFKENASVNWTADGRGSVEFVDAIDTEENTGAIITGMTGEFTFTGSKLTVKGILTGASNAVILWVQTSGLPVFNLTISTLTTKIVAGKTLEVTGSLTTADLYAATSTPESMTKLVVKNGAILTSGKYTHSDALDATEQVALSGLSRLTVEEGAIMSVTTPYGNINGSVLGHPYYIGYNTLMLGTFYSNSTLVNATNFTIVYDGFSLWIGHHQNSVGLPGLKAQGETKTTFVDEGLYLPTVPNGRLLGYTDVEGSDVVKYAVGAKVANGKIYYPIFEEAGEGMLIDGDVSLIGPEADWSYVYGKKISAYNSTTGVTFTADIESDGTFEFEDVSAGTYSIYIEGLETYSSEYEVTAGGSVVVVAANVTTSLEYTRMITVSGTVSDAETPTNPNTTTVYLYAEDGETELAESQVIATLGESTYSFTMPYGTVAKLKAVGKDNSDPAEVVGNVSVDYTFTTTGTKNLTLAAPLFDVSGTLKVGTKALAGVDLVMTLQNETEPLDTVTTDSDGKWAFTGIVRNSTLVFTLDSEYYTIVSDGDVNVIGPVTDDMTDVALTATENDWFVYINVVYEDENVNAEAITVNDGVSEKTLENGGVTLYDEANKIYKAQLGISENANVTFLAESYNTVGYISQKITESGSTVTVTIGSAYYYMSGTITLTNISKNVEIDESNLSLVMTVGEAGSIDSVTYNDDWNNGVASWDFVITGFETGATGKMVLTMDNKTASLPFKIVDADITTVAFNVTMDKATIAIDAAEGTAITATCDGAAIEFVNDKAQVNYGSKIVITATAEDEEDTVVLTVDGIIVESPFTIDSLTLDIEVEATILAEQTTKFITSYDVDEDALNFVIAAYEDAPIGTGTMTVTAWVSDGETYQKDEDLSFEEDFTNILTSYYAYEAGYADYFLAIVQIEVVLENEKSVTTNYMLVI